MQQWNCCPNGSFCKNFILKSNSHELSIKCKRKCSYFHIEQNTKHTLLLKETSVWLAKWVVWVPELSKAIIRKSKLIVWEWAVDIKGLLCCYSYLKLMLSSCICNNFPIMDSAEERPVGSNGPEIIVGLKQESMSVIGREGNLLWAYFWIPAKFSIHFWVHVIYLVVYCAMNILSCSHIRAQGLLLFKISELGTYSAPTWVFNCFWFVIRLGSWCVSMDHLISINAYDRLIHTSRLNGCLFKILLHFLTKHRLKCL